MKYQNVPLNLQYAPSGAIRVSFTWLDAAIKCKDFIWDSDQQECAIGSLADAQLEWDALVSRIIQLENELKQANTEIAASKSTNAVWGVDWGYRGPDTPCAIIVKRLPDGTNVIVDSSYAPNGMFKRQQ